MDRSSPSHDPPAEPRVPAEAVAARHDGRAGIAPGHLYRAVALAFVLALGYRFFDPIAQVLLLSYSAVILAVALNAVQKRIPLERKWVAVLMGIAGIALVAAVAVWGVPALIRQMRGLTEMLPALQKQFAAWEAWLRQTTGLNLKLPTFGGADQLGLGGKDVLGRAGNVVAAMFVPIVIFFGALFALAAPNDHLLTPLLRVVPTEQRPAFYRMLQLLGDRLLGWLRGTLTAMLGVGVLSVVVYWAIGVPYALLLGVINGLLEFIPLFGPWTGGILATLVAFIDDPSKAIWVAIAALGIQQVEANLITPWAMRQQAELHPFVTLFALILFGGIFGFMGLLLALPLTLLAWTAVQVFWVERAIDTDRDRIAPVVKE